MLLSQLWMEEKIAMVYVHIHILLCSNFNEMSYRPLGQWLIRSMINRKLPCNHCAMCRHSCFSEFTQNMSALVWTEHSVFWSVSWMFQHFAQTCDPEWTHNIKVWIYRLTLLHLKGYSIGYKPKTIRVNLIHKGKWCCNLDLIFIHINYNVEPLA